MDKEKEIQTYIKEFEKRTKEITSSKKKAQEYLISTGIYTKSGNLSKHYK